MKKMTFILFTTLLLILSLEAGARPVPVTYLTGTFNQNEFYQITFYDNKVILSTPVFAPCHLGKPCPPPENYERTVDIKLLSDKFNADGASVIDLGQQYSLHIYNDWKEKDSDKMKKYRLDLPKRNKQDRLNSVYLNLDLRIENL